MMPAISILPEQGSGVLIDGIGLRDQFFIMKKNWTGALPIYRRAVRVCRQGRLPVRRHLRTGVLR